MQPERFEESPEIRWGFRLYNDRLSRSGMRELEILRMQSNAGNSSFRRLLRAVLAVADDRMAEGRELYANLILQSGVQGNSQSGGAPEVALNRVCEFSTRRFGILG